MIYILRLEMSPDTPNNLQAIEAKKSLEFSAVLMFVANLKTSLT